MVLIVVSQGFDCFDLALQVHFLPCSYEVRCYGAKGGFGSRNGDLFAEGGNGALIIAKFKVVKEFDAFLFIGSAGQNGSSVTGTSAPGGWNGGGNGGIDINDDDGSGGGGGATDIRLVDSVNPFNVDSLKSRILVAAGGSGSAFSSFGAPGGNETGMTMIATQNPNAYQPSVNTTLTLGNDLGQGGNGGNGRFTPGSGAGGGFMGGIGREVYDVAGETVTFLNVGDSGSSFVNKSLFSEWEILVGGNTNYSNGRVEISQHCSAAFLQSFKKKGKFLMRNIFSSFILMQ